MVGTDKIGTDKKGRSQTIYKSDGGTWNFANVTLEGTSCGIATLDTISDLRTLTGNQKATVVCEPDGQSGLFLRKQQDPFGNGDDGGTALHNKNSDWWIRQAALTRSEVSVLWWGAGRDGKTNDAPAIQAAIDWAESQGPDVRVPAGTYRIGSQLPLQTRPDSCFGEPALKQRVLKPERSFS